MYNFAANPYPTQPQIRGSTSAPSYAHTRTGTAAQQQQTSTQPTIATLQQTPSKQLATIVFELFMYQIIQYYQQQQHEDDNTAPTATDGSLSKSEKQAIMIQKLDALGY